MSEKSELLPCPFCQKEPDVYDEQREKLWCITESCALEGITFTVTDWQSRAPSKLTKELAEACKLAHSALDLLMGDSDLDNDESPEMEACQALTKVIDKSKQEGVL